MQPFRKRLMPSWQPTWTPQVERWTAGQVRKNLWRFDRAEEFDDIMQDARLLFFTLRRKYPAVNEPAHYFALYRTSLCNAFTDKCRKLQRTVSIDHGVDADLSLEKSQRQGQPNCGYLNLLLEELPDELKLVLGALTTGRVRLKLDKSTKTLRRRENHNMRLKRQLGLSSKDPVGDLRCYFANS